MLHDDAPECCQLRQRLAENFAVAARLYAEAVVLLTASHGVSDSEYHRLRKAAAEAQYRCEEMRIAFEEHVASHEQGQNSLARAHRAG